MKKITCGTGVGRIQLSFAGHLAEPRGSFLSVSASSKEKVEGLPGVIRVIPTHDRFRFWVEVDPEIYRPLSYERGTPAVDGRQEFMIDGKILK